MKCVLVVTMGLGLVACTARDPLFCDEDHPCAEGKQCNLGTRTCEAAGGDAGVELGPPRPLGSGCDSPGQCESGFCVDKVCCEAACEGACRSCAVLGQEGRCLLAPDGTDDRGLCSGSAGCAGSCKEGACLFPEGQSCGEPACADGLLTTSHCDAKGSCEPASTTCGGYTCASGGECRTSCSTPGDCITGFECAGNACTSNLPLGSECGTNPKACASGNCVNGVCCDQSACPACKTCNGNPKGSCSPVADDTSCGAATCSSATKQAQLCKAGSCTSVDQSCGDYACNSAGTDCLTACNGTTGCSGSAYCELTVCKPKKANGVSCTSGGECASGICTDAEKVCCDTACAGDCETCAGKASCSPEPAGTPCGNQQLTCADTPTSSSINQPRCNANKTCTPTVVQTCDPYRCQNGTPPTCGTTCTKHADCTTLCDLFDKLNTCRPAGEVCFADVKTCPANGGGTQASPYCAIQQCLDSGKPYLAVADGTYAENLTTKRSVQLVSTGTAGPLLSGSTYQAKVLLQPSLASTVGLAIGSGHKVAIYGLDISPAPTSTGLLVQAKYADVTLRTSHVHGAHPGWCVHTITSKLQLDDVVVDACEQDNIHTEGSDVTMQGVGLYSSGKNGIYIDTGTVIMRDVTVSKNTTTGVHVYHGTLDLDRVRVNDNKSGGLHLENHTIGVVKNLLVYYNTGGGIYFNFNDVPPTFINATVTANTGGEVLGDTYPQSPQPYTTFHNSILWSPTGTWPVQPQLLLYSSDVSHTPLPATCPPVCAGTFNINPLFAGGTEKFTLLPSSPCVDAGNDTVPGLPTLDILKTPRQVDKSPGGNKVDLGAFEVQ